MSKGKNGKAAGNSGGNNGNLKPFKPGQSGNPNGRPSIPEEIKRAYREHSHEAIEVLVEVMRKGEGQHGTGRVKAAVEILNRAWGKPAETVTVEQHDDGRQEQLRAAWARLPQDVKDQFARALIEAGVGT